MSQAQDSPRASESRERIMAGADRRHRDDAALRRRAELEARLPPTPWRVVATLKKPLIFDAAGAPVHFSRRGCELVVALVNQHWAAVDEEPAQ
jgi:hypothetical protein